MRQDAGVPGRMGKWGGATSARQFLAKNPSPIPLRRFDAAFPKTGMKGAWQPEGGYPDLNDKQVRHEVCQRFKHMRS